MLEYYYFALLTAILSDVVRDIESLSELLRPL